jgi:hypothetical protein
VKTIAAGGIAAEVRCRRRDRRRQAAGGPCHRIDRRNDRLLRQLAEVDQIVRSGKAVVAHHDLILEGRQGVGDIGEAGGAQVAV